MSLHATNRLGLLLVAIYLPAAMSESTSSSFPVVTLIVPLTLSFSVEGNKQTRIITDIQTHKFKRYLVVSLDF
jgi:hypothetical protein